MIDCMQGTKQAEILRHEVEKGEEFVLVSSWVKKVF